MADDTRSDSDRLAHGVDQIWKSALGGCLVVAPVIVIAGFFDDPLVPGIVYLAIVIPVLVVVAIRQRLDDE